MYSHQSLMVACWVASSPAPLRPRHRHAARQAPRGICLRMPPSRDRSPPSSIWGHPTGRRSRLPHPRPGCRGRATSMRCEGEGVGGLQHSSLTKQSQRSSLEVPTSGPALSPDTARHHQRPVEGTTRWSTSTTPPASSSDLGIRAWHTTSWARSSARRNRFS